MKFHIANITHELYLYTFTRSTSLLPLHAGSRYVIYGHPPWEEKNKTKNEWITRVSRNKLTHAEKQTTGLEGIYTERDAVSSRTSGRRFSPRFAPKPSAIIKINNTLESVNLGQLEL